jgi:hypothetical protein
MPTRTKRSTLVFALALLASLPAAAWDRTGHLVVARIAWQQLSPAARSAAAELLASAPDDAGLRQLLPERSSSESEAQAEHFQRAAYWPDIVRDEAFPSRRDTYHHGDWHWINHFFEQRGTDRAAYELTDRPPVGRIVEQLEILVPAVGDATLPAAERAIDLAWVLHLGGDIHQPLHATARVTPTEPEGDRGGNLFALDGDHDLHSFWDGILSSSNFHWFFWSEDAYVRRIAASITAEHPPSEYGERIDNLDFSSWARESFEISMARVYELEPGERPPASYQRQAVEIARERIALAGYRLARVLESRLD